MLMSLTVRSAPQTLAGLSARKHVSRVVYTADQMKQFLINTKGQREVLVSNFYPNLQQFVKDEKYWLREGAIPKPHSFRLKKKVSDIRKALCQAEHDTIYSGP